MSIHRIQPLPPRRRRRRSPLRLLVNVILVASMIATGGFGVFPENPLTSAFQDVIGRTLPKALLNPVNDYLVVFSVPTIQPLPSVTPKPTFDLVDPLSTTVAIGIPKLATFIATGIPFISARESGTPVAAGTSTLASTSTSAVTQTATVTATPSLTSTPSLTATVTTTPTITRTPIAIDSDTNCPLIADAKQIVCYDVAGSTESELRVSMDELSPVAPLAFNVQWEMVWNWSGSGTNDCNLSSATVTVTELTVTLPRWNAPANASPQLVAKWNQFIQDSASWSQAYVDYLRVNFSSVGIAIQNATCSTANAEAQKAVDGLGASASQYADEEVGNPTFP